MRKALLGWMLVYALTACRAGGPRPSDIPADYISAWKDFYPTAAYAAGHRASAFRFETFSEETAAAWIRVNRDTLALVEAALPDAATDDAIDLKLLRRRIWSELEKWETGRALETSPALYSGGISQALTYVLVRSDLSPSEKKEAVRSRLAGIRELCAAGRDLLRDGRPYATARAIDVLEATAVFLSGSLPSIPLDGEGRPSDAIFREECLITADAARDLADFLRGELTPVLTLPDSRGRESYARGLRIFTGLDLTPEAMADSALQEIREVRNLMKALSAQYLEEPLTTVSKDAGPSLVHRALTEMESHRVGSQREMIELFTTLVDRAEDFLEEEDIATLPNRRSLVVDISPAHFAGAAVGGVYPAGPFNPEADTLFFLPSVPDEAPQERRDGFYRSFNNHFNTIIVPHEIYPGHYMQLKLAASQPRRVRALFDDGLYVEGWGSLCEVLALNAGWNDFSPLDRLAHLRKRLENAVRAFVSARVHGEGWDRERVIRFAVEEGWLAPQFADNLWDRVMSDPLQLTSYFLGFKRFSALLEAERERQGEKFRLRRFCDTVLRAGAVPIDALAALLRESDLPERRHADR